MSKKEEETIAGVQKEKELTINELYEAIKELTRAVGDLAKEWEKWRKAGKF